jgi:PAS domain S-box-containing protein
MAPVEIATLEPRSAVSLSRDRLRFEVLAGLGRALAAPLDLEGIFGALYRETARVLDASIFILGLYDEASGTVQVVGQMYGGVARPGGSFPLGEGISSQAIRTRQSSLIREWSREGPARRLRYASDGGALPESALSAPLLWGDRAVGVLLVEAYPAGAYDAEDMALLEAIASVATTAIENLRHSERLDAQLQRRVSELEATLSSMADALVILDPAGAIVGLNPAARALLGADEGTIVVGRPLDEQGWEGWPEDAREVAAALAPLAEAVRQGLARQDVETELSAGGRRVLSFSAAPLPGADGRPGGGIVVFRDVTGRREVERLKDEVLSIASHDLKSPITTLRARAQLLQSRIEAGSATPEQLTSGLGKILAQTDRLVAMLELLLDVSHAEAGRFAVAPARSDLVAIAERVVAAAQITTERHRLTVSGPRSLEGVWDEGRLEQVLQNLVQNAVKYSPAGGAVEVTLAVDDRHVRVSVRDEGVGMVADDLPKVFDRFYRTGPLTLEGTGLGLYICRTIVTAHGGRIWAESPGPGQGSTLAFTLPLAGPTGRPA